MPFYMIQELDPNEACDDIAVAGGLGWWSWLVVLAGGVLVFYRLSALLVSFTLIGMAVDAKLASCRVDKDCKSRR